MNTLTRVQILDKRLSVLEQHTGKPTVSPRRILDRVTMLHLRLQALEKHTALHLVEDTAQAEATLSPMEGSYTITKA